MLRILRLEKLYTFIVVHCSYAWIRNATGQCGAGISTVRDQASSSPAFCARANLVRFELFTTRDIQADSDHSRNISP